METARLGLTPSKLITEKSVENALRVLLALGGSTNGILHLTAIAGRRGIAISLNRLNELSDTTPVLVNLKPTGVGYMEDFHTAGGMGTLLRELQPLLHMDCQTVTGETLGERLKTAPGYVDRAIIRSREEPFEAVGGLVALFGNLAPGGAILKRSAADPTLFEHTGRAVVFTSLEDLADRIDSDDLDVKADDILVLQNAGPKSPAGMPEAGYIPIPKKLARAGVKDMVRISDCRMSGTAFGTIVLHVTPEAAMGGVIGLVQNGDEISLSISGKSLILNINDDEIARRRQAMPPQPARPARGYAKLYADHVTQADQGADFDFLMAAD
jgi:dihydroxy-acid dehydratase